LPASEEELVNRVVLKFQPSVLAQAAFVERPRSRRDLIEVVKLMEEKFATAREKEKNNTVRVPSGNEPGPSRKVLKPPPRSVRCSVLKYR
jgi:hypothetical protein